MSAATSRATSRGPSRTPSRGATQDLDSFDTMQPRNSQGQNHSLDTSKKQLLQRQQTSSQPVAEGHGGGLPWQLHKQPATDRHTIGHPHHTWLQSLCQWITHQRTRSSSSDNLNTEHSRDVSSTNMQLFLEILAAQPSQSASSAALPHQSSDLSPSLNKCLKTPPVGSASGTSGQSGQAVNSTACKAHFSRNYFSHPQPVAEGTEDRTATKTSLQRPGMGFMSGGTTGRSAPATRHAAVIATALGTHSADVPVNSQLQPSFSTPVMEQGNQQGELSLAIPPADLYDMWVPGSTSWCTLIIAHMCLELFIAHIPIELVNRAHSLTFAQICKV